MRITSLALAVCLFAVSLPVVANQPAAGPVVLRYRLTPGESLRYRLTADMHGSVPILDSPEPTELNATIKIVYIATPKTKLSDGTSDVEFKVETAELEIEKIPFPLADDQAQQILNQTVSMAHTGEVKKVHAGAPLPFGVSIPGVDPKRLYALLFPIVFPEKAVKAGDKWNYKSELLGGQGTAPQFSATWLLPAAASPAQQLPQVARFSEQFQMGVDQKLDKDKKPVKEGESVRYTRSGTIEGTGLFNFHRDRGIVESGTVTIKANVNEDLVGEPDREDQPKRMTSKVDAKVRVELEPAAKVSPAQSGKDRP